jgi:Epoxide hydrolase N terminus/Thioredoxin like C-terminal domain
MWWAGRCRHFEGASLARHIRWRKVEATLNALPQFITKIDGLDIQFAHIRSPHQDALPLLMTHGWPGSISLDGDRLGKARGIDVDDRGEGVAADRRLYQLVRQPGDVDERTLEITFLERGVETFRRPDA